MHWEEKGSKYDNCDYYRYSKKFCLLPHRYENKWYWLELLYLEEILKEKYGLFYNKAYYYTVNKLLTKSDYNKLRSQKV